MNETDWTAVAAEALTKAKRLAPAKVAKPDAQLAEEWGGQLQRTGLPAQVWLRAAEVWATEQAEESLDIRALIAAGRLVIRRMESGNAEQRLWLAKWRAQRLQANYQALGLGDGGVDIPAIALNRTDTASERTPGQLIAETKKRAQNAK